MSESRSHLERPLLQEFEPLTNLLSRVPRRIKKGVLMVDLTWTCIDVNDHWIAIGTDAGVVYVYHRPRETIVHQLTSQVTEVCTVILCLLKLKVLEAEATAFQIFMIWKLNFAVTLVS